MLSCLLSACEHDCTSYSAHYGAAVEWRNASLTVDGQSVGDIETTTSWARLESVRFSIRIDLSTGDYVGIECAHDMSRDAAGRLVELCGAETNIETTASSFYRSHTPAGTIAIEDTSRSPTEGGSNDHARVQLDVDTDLPAPLDPTLPPAHLVLQGSIELTASPVPYTYRCGGSSPFGPLDPGSLPGGG